MRKTIMLMGMLAYFSSCSKNNEINLESTTEQKQIEILEPIEIRLERLYSKTSNKEVKSFIEKLRNNNYNLKKPTAPPINPLPVQANFLDENQVASDFSTVLMLGDVTFPDLQKVGTYTNSSLIATCFGNWWGLHAYLKRTIVKENDVFKYSSAQGSFSLQGLTEVTNVISVSLSNENTYITLEDNIVVCNFSTNLNFKFLGDKIGLVTSEYVTRSLMSYIEQSSN